MADRRHTHPKTWWGGVALLCSGLVAWGFALGWFLAASQPPEIRYVPKVIPVARPGPGCDGATCYYPGARGLSRTYLGANGLRAP